MSQGFNPLHVTNTKGERQVFKLGLPGRTIARQLPQLAETSMPVREFKVVDATGAGQWSLPPPNITFTPVPGMTMSRSQQMSQMRKEQEALLNSRPDPRFIERR